MKWGIKLPFGGDYVFVSHFVDGSDVVTPLLFNTEEEALKAAKIWKNYKVVQYESGS